MGRQRGARFHGERDLGRRRGATFVDFNPLVAGCTVQPRGSQSLPRIVCGVMEVTT